MVKQHLPFFHLWELFSEEHHLFWSIGSSSLAVGTISRHLCASQRPGWNLQYQKLAQRPSRSHSMSASACCSWWYCSQRHSFLFFHFVLRLYRRCLCSMIWKLDCHLGCPRYSNRLERRSCWSSSLASWSARADSVCLRHLEAIRSWLCHLFSLAEQARHF